MHDGLETPAALGAAGKGSARRGQLLPFSRATQCIAVVGVEGKPKSRKQGYNCN
jgi:hypothetical protein